MTSCASTGIKCSVTGGGTPATCGDITDTAPINQGDGIQIVDATAMSSAAKDARVTVEIQ
jgi:hypothetical protein